MGDAISDPLLAAIIGKLPPPGAAWAKADRINWLRMFVMAANVAYGDAAGISVADVEEKPPLRFAPVSVYPPKEGVVAGLREVLDAPPAREPRFTIDADGFAMRDGLPIDPEDVPAGAVIWDERRGAEQGDVQTIYWKNGGILKGVVLTQLKLQAA